jgi:hypothetical protein
VTIPHSRGAAFDLKLNRTAKAASTMGHDDFLSADLINLRDHKAVLPMQGSLIATRRVISPPKIAVLNFCAIQWDCDDIEFVLFVENSQSI